jgi:hypothetical protein
MPLNAIDEVLIIITAIDRTGILAKNTTNKLNKKIKKNHELQNNALKKE